jgi:hypothetical protein
MLTISEHPLPPALGQWAGRFAPRGPDRHGKLRRFGIFRRIKGNALEAITRIAGVTGFSTRRDGRRPKSAKARRERRD